MNTVQQRTNLPPNIFLVDHSFANFSTLESLLFSAQMFMFPHRADAAEYNPAGGLAVMSLKRLHVVDDRFQLERRLRDFGVVMQQ